MSAQYPTVPPLPGVPSLASLATAAENAAAATVAGEAQALASQLGLPAGVTFGSNALYSGLDLSSLNSASSTPSLPANGGVQSGQAISTAGPSYAILVQSAQQTAVTAVTGTAVLAILPDSALELEYGADSTLNSHPVEQGGFAAYNRVQEPRSIRLLLACQGKNMARSAFLAALEGLREGTQLVTISTPDTTYPNMVLKGFGYKKSAERGAVTIYADTQWQEERSTNVVVSAPPTSQPQGAANSNLGSLTPATPTAQQQASISNPPVPPVQLGGAADWGIPPSEDAF